MTKLPVRHELLASTAIPPPRLPARVDKNRAIDRTTWNSMVAAARLPTGKFDENRIIDCIDSVVLTIRRRIEKEASWEAIRNAIERLLRKGQLDFAVTTIALADKGDEICDAALWNVFADIVGGALPERGPGHLQVLAYGQRAALRAPHERPPRGHRWHDKWMRNLLTCWLIFFVERDFGIGPSCNRGPKHDKRPRALSGISIVVAALARHGVELDATNVQENIWFGPAGDMVRNSARRFASETVDNSIL
jgi:hypothetical protein